MKRWVIYAALCVAWGILVLTSGVSLDTGELGLVALAAGYLAGEK